MTKPSDFHQLLRGAALRVTRPRTAVLRAVHASPHADTDSIIEAVRRSFPGCRTRPYDSLRALTAAGSCGASSRPGPWPAMSRVGDNHHHVVCRSCGVIADVDCAVGDVPCLTASDSRGFVIEEAEVVYWGLCPACSTARSS